MDQELLRTLNPGLFNKFGLVDSNPIYLVNFKSVITNHIPVIDFVFSDCEERAGAQLDARLLQARWMKRTEKKSPGLPPIGDQLPYDFLNRLQIHPEVLGEGRNGIVYPGLLRSSAALETQQKWQCHAVQSASVTLTSDSVEKNDTDDGEPSSKDDDAVVNIPVVLKIANANVGYSEFWTSLSYWTLHWHHLTVLFRELVQVSAEVCSSPKNLSLRDQYGRYLNLIKATMTAMFRFQHRLADSVKTYRYLIPSLKKLNLVGLITGTDSLAAILKYFFYSLQEALSDGGGGGGDENCTDKILSWPRIRLALAPFLQGYLERLGSLKRANRSSNNDRTLFFRAWIISALAYQFSFWWTQHLDLCVIMLQNDLWSATGLTEPLAAWTLSQIDSFGISPNFLRLYDARLIQNPFETFFRTSDTVSESETTQDVLNRDSAPAIREIFNSQVFGQYQILLTRSTGNYPVDSPALLRRITGQDSAKLNSAQWSMVRSAAGLQKASRLAVVLIMERLVATLYELWNVADEQSRLFQKISTRIRFDRWLQPLLADSTQIAPVLESKTSILLRFNISTSEWQFGQIDTARLESILRLNTNDETPTWSDEIVWQLWLAPLAYYGQVYSKSIGIELNRRVHFELDHVPNSSKWLKNQGFVWFYNLKSGSIQALISRQKPIISIKSKSWLGPTIQALFFPRSATQKAPEQKHKMTKTLSPKMQKGEPLLLLDTSLPLELHPSVAHLRDSFYANLALNAQTCIMLLTAQTLFKHINRDLHPNNLMFASTCHEHLFFDLTIIRSMSTSKIGTRDPALSYEVVERRLCIIPTFGMIIKMIDEGWSSLVVRKIRQNVPLDAIHSGLGDDGGGVSCYVANSDNLLLLQVTVNEQLEPTTDRTVFGDFLISNPRTPENLVDNSANIDYVSFKANDQKVMLPDLEDTIASYHRATIRLAPSDAHPGLQPPDFDSSWTQTYLRNYASTATNSSWKDYLQLGLAGHQDWSSNFLNYIPIETASLIASEAARTQACWDFDRYRPIPKWQYLNRKAKSVPGTPKEDDDTPPAAIVTEGNCDQVFSLVRAFFRTTGSFQCSEADFMAQSRLESARIYKIVIDISSNPFVTESPI